MTAPHLVTAKAARLTELVTPAVTAAGRRSVVRVVVDKDGGVTLDDVAEVSRALGEALDAADEADPALLGPSYVLEVSSPGVDRPLTEPRHWRRNVGRLVVASLTDGGERTGRVARADEATVVLSVDGAEQVLTYAELVRGTVQVEFSRKDDPAEDTDDPADEEHA